MPHSALNRCLWINWRVPHEANGGQLRWVYEGDIVAGGDLLEDCLEGLPIGFAHRHRGHCGRGVTSADSPGREWKGSRGVDGMVVELS